MSLNLHHLQASFVVLLAFFILLVGEGLSFPTNVYAVHRPRGQEVPGPGPVQLQGVPPYWRQQERRLLRQRVHPHGGGGDW